ncbi:hypothetical protein [Streptomyces sp. enrichment culture]|uniref:hypothetical protein n=1 Tax=Streptomyces sp. enrichment culture TaxID=1795815 RepID=UPI003F54F74D
MIYLGAYGPLRPEELAGLRRRDVDLDTLRIRVRLAEPERMNGRRVRGDTKSEAGTRTVILPAFLRREFRWHWSRTPSRGRTGWKARAAAVKKVSDEPSGTDLARGN